MPTGDQIGAWLDSLSWWQSVLVGFGFCLLTRSVGAFVYAPWLFDSHCKKIKQLEDDVKKLHDQRQIK